MNIIIDAVASGASQTNIYDTLSVDGPKKIGEVFIGTQIQVPESVKRTIAFRRQVFDAPGRKNAITASATLLSEERYKQPNQVQRIETGFGAIAEGLEMLLCSFCRPGATILNPESLHRHFDHVL